MHGYYNKWYVLILVLLCCLVGISDLKAQKLNYSPNILLVTAHPDDDALYSATVFKTTHLLDGTVDLAVMTNGEGGYRYSTLGNYIYGKELDKEEVGRDYLPGIRKRELMAGGRIVGIRNYYFLEQVDDRFSYDIANALEAWNTDWIERRLADLIQNHRYDFVFTMLPSDSTHAHHKASAILTLRAIESLESENRPIVLATTYLRDKDDESSFRVLEGYPISEINRSAGHFVFDRTQKFGYNNRLDYNIITNWVIAEHKSQGTMQQVMNLTEAEEYWLYEMNPEGSEEKTRAFFEAVIGAQIYFPDTETELHR